MHTGRQAGRQEHAGSGGAGQHTEGNEKDETEREEQTEGQADGVTCEGT